VETAGPAIDAGLGGYPVCVAVDASHNYYISNGYYVRKVNTAGIITTVAGNGTGGSTGDGGPATDAALYACGLAIDGSGNIYISTGLFGSTIRMVNSSGIITTIAGHAGSYAYSGDGGPATDAYFFEPWGLAIDALGNLYIGDALNYAVRMINTSGIISTIAGTGPSHGGYSGDRSAATSAELYEPFYICFDASGNLYISDYGNNVVRMVNTSGIISTIAGNYSLGPGYGGDGMAATSAQLWGAFGLAADASGNIYICDYDNDVVRMVNTSGIITTVAGNYPLFIGYSGDGGPAVNAQLYEPIGITIDGGGNIFIADEFNYVIREIPGTVTLCTGTPTPLGDGTSGTWSSSDISVATIGSSTSVATGISPGTTILSYTNYGSTITINAIVISSPHPISGITPVCSGTAIELTDHPTGGTWSSGNISVGTIDGSGNVTGVASGTAIISYTVSNGCSATVALTVNPSPDAITGAVTICPGGTTTLSDDITGGIWSSSNASIASVGTGGAVSGGSSGGTATISYILPAGCYTTIGVSVSPAISGPTGVCIGTDISLTGSPGGGTWSCSAPPSIATVGIGTGVVTGNGSGTATITYSNMGCIATMTVTVVNSLPPITPYPGCPEFCFDFCTVCEGCIEVFDAIAGGTWTSSNTAVLAIGYTTSAISPVSLGTAIITYSTGSGCYVTQPVSTRICDTRYANPNGITSAPIIYSTLSVFPNPTNGNFTIKGSFQAMSVATSNKCDIEVFDLLGQKVFSDAAPIIDGGINKDIGLDNHIANGIYLIRVSTDNGSEMLRVSVNR
jgi:hypothetical protein